MKIAICDSNVNYLKNLKNSIYNFFNFYKIDFLVDVFTKGEDLLKSDLNYFLIITEYNLCGINGLEMAKQLRKIDNKTEIIFLSKNTDFIFESFKVSPYRFLTKPLNESVLFDTLKDFFNTHNENYPLLITNSVSTYCVNVQDIIYLEANNKHCFIHSYNETIHCNKTMARVFSTLPEKYFIKINRAFIVNLNYISKYNSEYVYLKSGQKIHISRNYYKYFKQEYIKFIKPKII